MVNFNAKFYPLMTALVVLFLAGCTKDEPIVTTVPVPPVPNPTDTTTLGDGPVDFSTFSDTYGNLASANLASEWRHYNVHDPAYIVDDEFTYCYNTDVAFGHAIRPGLQIRRSKNLVEWEFVGWAFSGIPSLGANYIRRNGGEPVDGLWAPYIIKVGTEYRLYYSLASSVGRLSAIGMGTSASPNGPFREQDLVVTSLGDASVHTNAIDPSVVVGEDGRHWMYYGSSWDGIYKMELDPTTGLALIPNDKGVRVAHRGFTDNTINGNIEGPEIIYNPELDKYYLFIAYDWLQTKYNVRVGRSDNPQGPFFDIRGNDMNQFQDDGPMILAPYRFAGHSGWQGVSHPGVFSKDGDFYIGHQGRPGENSFYMVMHTRQLFWTEDGWPLVSSQRYATEEETAVAASEIAGKWEFIIYTYNIVPGFAEEQTSPDFINSQMVSLRADGTIEGSLSGSWSYDAPWLSLEYAGSSARVRIERGRDWENSVSETVLFTGMEQDYTTVWGKKISN